MKLVKVISLIIFFTLSINANDMDALSKELVNPIGMKWKLNNFVEVDKVSGDATSENSTSSIWNMQPVMPIMMGSSGYTLMNRPSLPIYINKPVLKNINNQNIHVNDISGIGDLTLQSSIGKMPKTSWGSYMWGGGLGITLPTASKDELGTGKYSAGPTGMLVGFTQNYTFGFVAAHEWSFAGDSDRKNVNQSVFQPLYYMQLGGGWQIGDNPQWKLNWGQPTGEKYNIPIGLGLFKTMKISGSPWRFGLTPRYYIKSNERFGSKWGMNFTITKVIQSPFKM